MAGRRTRSLTLIIVPGSHQRLHNIRLPIWLLTAGLLILIGAVAFSAISVYDLAQRFRQAAAELTVTVPERDALRADVTQKDGQIRQMTRQVDEIESDLVRLRELEDSIRKLLDERGADAEPTPNTAFDAPPGASAGRGGPDPEYADWLLADSDRRPRVTASRSAGAFRRSAGGPAAEAIVRLEAFQSEATLRAEGLAKSAEALRNRLDYLAHRPTGWPVSGFITDDFGWRQDPLGRGVRFHEGVDIAAQYGDPVVATGAGEVVFAGWKVGGYGFTVIVDHGYGLQTAYAHNAELMVEVGDQVKRGHVLALVGSSGHSTGPHVHYEVYLWGREDDPAKYLD